MRRSHRETFTTIKTEGALLPVEILQRIAEGDRDLDGLSPESYHLSKNEKLNEAINRAWNRCDGAWRSFQGMADILPESDAGTTVTRERWLLILFQELGYGRLLISKAQQINGKSYPISHAWHHSPIHLISLRQDLDRRTPGVAGAARMSPHSMVQEFLNRSDDHLWGVVSNGLTLRLLRDNFSLTRQAYVEFDLQAMMSGEVYSDFILLFLVLHQSRVEAERPEQCWLERWTQEAQRRGTRALDQLRKGVQQAIQTLGQGFLAHPANSTLSQKLQSGVLTPHGLYEQLLRLVYRLIFLFVAEDRDLLLGTDTPPEARSRYMDHYSLTRIRRIAGRLRGTQHGDLWQGIRVAFRCLIDGEPAMGLSPLGGFLFSTDALADLNDCDLSNDALLTAVRHLSFTRDRRMLRPVDYRNLGTEELGSVYESLLELHPEVNVSASTFELRVAAGSKRKTTGSYYTPSSLIRCLLDSALEPVIASTLKKPDPEKALLDLKVVDPACGSGHFLIAAAHRIGKHLAIIRTGEIEPPPEERRKALRDVVSHCIYGVDINPLAVELCKVALWIETLDPGRPLGFLDHRIKCGNSLIGATPELLEKGIPDDAFKPVEGDDKKIASFIRKKNKEERKGQRGLFAPVVEKLGWQTAAEDFKAWGQLPEDAFGQVCEKVAQYGALVGKPSYQHEKQVADLWTVAFFWPLTEKTVATVPTEDVFRRFQEGNSELKKEMQEQLEQLTNKHYFFHWHLEFPEVFAENGDGGFDCVLGNPPWDQLQFRQQEFFATSRPDVAQAATGAARKGMLKNLRVEDPTLYAAYAEARRAADSSRHFVLRGGRYPLAGRGRINTYGIFVETGLGIARETGRAGLIVPSGIATDDSTKLLFHFCVESRRLVSLFDFENRANLFPAVDSRYKFCLLTLAGGAHTIARGADFAFFAHNPEDIADNERRFTLSAEDIAVLNPNTHTCPIFRSKRDAQLTKAIYRQVPVFMKEGTPGENPWGVFTKPGLFNMTGDSDLFYTREKLEDLGGVLKGNVFVGDDRVFLPLYEGKMFTFYDHRFASVILSEKATLRKGQPEVLGTVEHLDPQRLPLPRYWVDRQDVEQRLLAQWERNWIIGWKEITSSTNERTLISAILPRVGIGHKVPVAIPSPQCTLVAPLLVTCLSTFVCDFVARQKLGGTSLTPFTFKQLPVLPPAAYSMESPWCKVDNLKQWLMPRIIELTYTAWDLESFAKNYAYHGPPFRWNEERRFLLRCELDSAYFHLYGIERDDVDYVMETFPIVKRKDGQKHGEYRTKRVILECYDAMAEAMKTSRPYKTILDPPAADPRVAHQPMQNLGFSE